MRRRRAAVARAAYPCPSVDAVTRSQVRGRVSDARRRVADAELDAYGEADLQTAAMKSRALPFMAWEACDGDPLLALAYVLDVLEAKREAAEAA